MWDIASGTRILSVPNRQPSDAVAFTPDGHALVTAGRDNRLRVWRPAVGSLEGLLAERSARAGQPGATPEPDVPWKENVLAGHVKEVYVVAVSPDGSRIASAGGDGKAMVWDTATGQLLLTLAGHVGTHRRARLQSRRREAGDRRPRQDGEAVEHRRARRRRVERRLQPRRRDRAGDGRGRSHRPRVDLSSGTPRLAHRLEGHTNAVYRLAFDPAGRRLVTGGLDGKALLWDVASGAQLRAIGKHRDKVLDVAFSPDGTLVATASADGTAQLTPADDSPSAGAPVTVEHGRPVAAVAFRPGRPEWLTAGWDGTLKLWSLTGESLGGVAHPDGDRATKVFGVAVHPDGSEVVALTGRELLIWPLASFSDPKATPRARVTLPGAQWCDSITYSPDGSQLAVACADGSVHLFDMPAATPAKTITVHRDEVTQAAFSPDGRRLATASLDKSFHVSPLPYDELHATATRLQAATAGAK